MSSQNRAAIKEADLNPGKGIESRDSRRRICPLENGTGANE